MRALTFTHYAKRDNIVFSDIARPTPKPTRFRSGDAVFASTFDSRVGSLAEFALVREIAAARKPTNLDFAQATSIPMVGLTSWQALKERAKGKVVVRLK